MKILDIISLCGPQIGSKVKLVNPGGFIGYLTGVIISSNKGLDFIIKIDQPAPYDAFYALLGDVQVVS